MLRRAPRFARETRGCRFSCPCRLVARYRLQNLSSGRSSRTPGLSKRASKKAWASSRVEGGVNTLGCVTTRTNSASTKTGSAQGAFPQRWLSKRPRQPRGAWFLHDGRTPKRWCRAPSSTVHQIVEGVAVGEVDCRPPVPLDAFELESKWNRRTRPGREPSPERILDKCSQRHALCGRADLRSPKGLVVQIQRALHDMVDPYCAASYAATSRCHPLRCPRDAGGRREPLKVLGSFGKCWVAGGPCP